MTEYGMSMGEIADSELADPEEVRFDGAVVGWIGHSKNTGKKCFAWEQSTYFYSEGGYSMSSSLYNRLKEKDVEYIFVPPAFAYETVQVDEFLREARIVSELDDRFNSGYRPNEQQFVYPADEPAES